MTIPRDDTDFYAWTQAQAQAVQAKDWPILDVVHWANVIETLGMQEKHAMSRPLPCLLAHLLKWRDHPTHRTPSWRRTIRQAREAIAEVIDDSHSLHSYPAPRVLLAYRQARRDAADDTGLPLATFPEVCPWSLPQVLEEDFWPEA